MGLQVAAIKVQVQQPGAIANPYLGVCVLGGAAEPTLLSRALQRAPMAAKPRPKGRATPGPMRGGAGVKPTRERGPWSALTCLREVDFKGGSADGVALLNLFGGGADSQDSAYIIRIRQVCGAAARRNLEVSTAHGCYS